MKVIDSFRGDYAFLSNFFIHDMKFKDRWYLSSEHAYQAAKAVWPEEHDYVSLALTCKEAKKRGREIECRDDWEYIKNEVMQEILWCKFQNYKLAMKLIDTGDAELIEGNWWGDTYWGICNGKGLNMLGEMLMAVRDWLISGLPEGKFDE